MKKSLVIIACFILLISCGKEEGIGGKNTVEGIVMLEEYTESTNQFITSYPASEERVYIIYGENPSYADDYRTNFDGSFRFEYLYKGAYTLFVYSECLACPSGNEPLFIDLTLENRKEVFEVDTIFVKKFIN